MILLFFAKFVLYKYKQRVLQSVKESQISDFKLLHFGKNKISEIFRNIRWSKKKSRLVSSILECSKRFDIYSARIKVVWAPAVQMAEALGVCVDSAALAALIAKANRSPQPGFVTKVRWRILEHSPIGKPNRALCSQCRNRVCSIRIAKEILLAIVIVRA